MHTSSYFITTKTNSVIIHKKKKLRYISDYINDIQYETVFKVNCDLSLGGKKLFIHQISSNYFGCSILTCTWLFMHLLLTQHISFIYKRKLITANLKSSCIHIHIYMGEHNRIFFVLLKIIIKNLLKQLERRTPQNDEVKRQIWFLLCLCDIQKRIRQALPLQYKHL